MKRVLQLARGVARTPATVLITGESGTGKEVLAQLIHSRSARANAPFVALNCGAINASLAESELFGHEKGAFSGATERRTGRFEAAHHGTLLLDEISELPYELQVKLLRVLQERELSRVGSASTISVDVRVIATSNKDLRREVSRGTFREDLFYRLNVFPIHIPPLRERPEDLSALCATLLAQLARRFERNHAPALAPEAYEQLSRYPWPGNVRELRNVLERALIMATGDLIESQDVMVEDDVHALGKSCLPGTINPAESAGQVTLSELERQAILHALDACDGNRTHASRRLGISLRTLRNRLRDYRDAGYPVPTSHHQLVG